jgi:Ni/Co efflux regulator RcnB
MKILPTPTIASLLFSVCLVGAPAFAVGLNRGDYTNPIGSVCQQSDGNSHAGDRDKAKHSNKTPVKGASSGPSAARGSGPSKAGQVQASPASHRGTQNAQQNAAPSTPNAGTRTGSASKGSPAPLHALSATAPHIDRAATTERAARGNRNDAQDRSVTTDRNARPTTRRADVTQYRRNVDAPRRFRAAAYQAPRGYSYRRWSYGQRLPAIYFGSNYRLADFVSYGLFGPPDGYVWVRYGDDALLVDEETGEIIQVDYNVFY